MSASLLPIDLRCEFLRDPLAVPFRHPRLSWRFAPGPEPIRQTRYHIQVSATRSALMDGKADRWDSGEVASSQSLDVRYEGSPLGPLQEAWWRVRAWGADGQAGPWSDPAQWDAGLPHNNHWAGRWITHPEPGDASTSRPCPLVRKAFDLPAGTIRRARLFVSARGLLIPHVNGRRLGGEFLPGWTDYGKRIQYDAFDVTASVRAGQRNVLAAIVGDGWYCGQVCWFGRNQYGALPMALLHLHVDYEGRDDVAIGSDRSWRAAYGPILASDMMQGETYDAGREIAGWLDPTFDDGSWPTAMEMGLGQALLVPRLCGQVEVGGLLDPVLVEQKGPGRFLIDFGQNHAGNVEFSAREGTADRVTVRHAEILTPEGELYTTNLRSAKAIETVETRGRAIRYAPSFTFHGYRYAEIAGFRDGAQPENVRSRVLHSAMERTGWFECSHPALNRLFENSLWSMRSNFLEVPTDCPQRDERLGWMGDIQVFGPSAAYLYHAAPLLAKWMQDVLDGASDDGVFPNVAPQIEQLADGAPGWADAGVIVPWTLYRYFGDETVLERCYPAMAKYLDTILAANPDFVWRHRRSHDFGDWLNVGDDTDRGLLGTAFLHRDAQILELAAQALGRKHDAPKWRAIRGRVAKAFSKEYIRGAKLSSDTQTAYALAIEFGIGDPAAWRKRLEALIAARGGHLSTGFLGVAYLMPALVRIGRPDLAYRLLLNDTYPSWLYSIRHGATTIWERWDGWTDTKGFQDPGMNSFNHYAFGSVAEWMMAAIGGISVAFDRPLSVRLSPLPGGGLAWANARWDCRYGPIRSEWKLEDGRFQWDVEVPPNFEVSATLPALEGVWRWKADGRDRRHSEPFRLGSGRHLFVGERNGEANGGRGSGV